MTLNKTFAISASSHSVTAQDVSVSLGKKGYRQKAVWNQLAGESQNILGSLPGCLSLVTACWGDSCPRCCLGFTTGRNQRWGMGPHCAATSGTSTVVLKIKTKIFQPPAMKEDHNLKARKEEIVRYDRKKTSERRLTSEGGAAAHCACLSRAGWGNARVLWDVFSSLAHVGMVCHVTVY